MLWAAGAEVLDDGGNLIRKTMNGAQPVKGAAAQGVQTGKTKARPFLYWLAWFGAVLMLTWLGYVVLLKTGVVSAARDSDNAEAAQVMSAAIPQNAGESAPMPDLALQVGAAAIDRSAQLHTIIPSRPRTDPSQYKVEAGDSVFGIAQKFKLKPETVLWANYKLLNDNPNDLSTNMELTIPAVDGILYQVKAGDTLAGIAKKYKAVVDDIIGWPGNKIDIADPQLIVGNTILIPGGTRETRQWVVPTIWRANSGANRSVNAGCDTSGVNVMGSGSFLWPADNHSISGNDFWSGHLGIDISAGMGANVYAADSGVVVYAAGIGGGYGNMIMIDHGNGYHTLYAHLSAFMVRCGQGVSRGQLIAYAGSTGNSTGPHLHFEIRYFDQFMNPHDFVR